MTDGPASSSNELFLPDEVSDDDEAPQDDEVPQDDSLQMKDRIQHVNKPLDQYGPGVDGMEVFSAPRVMPYLSELGLAPGPSIDLKNGFDLLLNDVQLQVMNLVSRLQPNKCWSCHRRARSIAHFST